MKTRIVSPIVVLAAMAALGLSATLATADTLVQGVVAGTWTRENSPYRLIDNCTVNSGQTLIVEPGVRVRIDAGFSLNVYGTLLATGTPSARISFESRIPSTNWQSIYIRQGGSQSQFGYCDISGAVDGVYFYSYDNDATTTLMFDSCNFSNCLNSCISVVAQGETHGSPGGAWAVQPTVALDVANCRFLNSSNAIYASSLGDFHQGVESKSWIHPSIRNSLFKNIVLNAVALAPGGSAGGGTVQIYNNLFSQCGTAIVTADPFDCRVNNNIGTGCVTVIQEAGALSRDVKFNCLYGNNSNFSGYPPAYGTFDDVNANGTTADAFMNINVDPQFAEITNYTLSGTSPCIDAGNSAGAFLDTFFPPSQGTTVNDIGLYGGPLAGNWTRTNAYNGTTNFVLTAQRYVGVTISPAGAGQYRLDYRHNVNTGLWTQATNVNLLSTPWTWIDYDSPGIDQRFFRAVKLP